jgi:hypothetical protein
LVLQEVGKGKIVAGIRRQAGARILASATYHRLSYSDDTPFWADNQKNQLKIKQEDPNSPQRQRFY